MAALLGPILSRASFGDIRPPPKLAIQFAPDVCGRSGALRKAFHNLRVLLARLDWPGSASRPQTSTLFLVLADLARWCPPLLFLE
jgi:hypothetical protein